MPSRRRTILPSRLRPGVVSNRGSARLRRGEISPRGLPSIRVVPLRLTTREDVLDLVADLRDALRRSERTGAQHPIFRKAPDDSCHLAIEIQVPPRFRGVRKKKGGGR